MRYLLRLATAALLLLLLVAPARAQGRLIITDPGGRLDQGAIEDAAQPLLDRGAQVAVYLVQSGGENDFIERLVEDGLARNDGLARTNMIALYVALDQRHSSIRFGDDWNFALSIEDNYDTIRETVMNPGLSAGDFTAAFVDTLDAVEAAIVSPPSPGADVNIDPTPVVAGGLGLAAVAAGGYALSRRNRSRKIRAAAEGKLREAREGAGSLIAGLGQRFRNAEEKARFDKVSYVAADVQRLERLQAAARQSFVKVQTDFDDVGERLERSGDKATNEQLAQATADFAAVQADAQAVEQQLAAVESLRAELDKQAAEARTEVDGAKKS